MSTLTPNYGLIKPDPDTDFAIVQDINDNYDILDTEVKIIEDLKDSQASIEYGLDYIDFGVLTPGTFRQVSAGNWGTLFSISQSTAIENATKWLLDVEFTGEELSGEPTSLSVRIDRGINHGGTMILQSEIRGGTGGAPIFESTSRESAVASAITTFTLLPTPFQDGVGTQYHLRFACFGETPNGHLLDFEVSPIGNGALFANVIGRLTFGE